MVKTPKTKNADENTDTEGEESGQESQDNPVGWWGAGKKGKHPKKVRYVCSGGEEPCDKVIGGKEKSIQCDACVQWFHAKCQSLYTEAFNAIGLYKLFWICMNCRKRVTEVLDTGKRVEACVEQAEKRIMKAISDSKKDTAVEMEKNVEGQLKKIEEQVTKQFESSSETLKKVVQNQERVAETQERCANLIIHGLQESQKSDASQRKEEDRKNIMELSKAVCGEDASLQISDVIRLRKKTDGNQAATSDKPGLVLVKFETKDDANKLFQKRLELRRAGYANVYINRDLNKEDREKEFKLRAELRAKGKETHRIFRGKVVPRDQ